MPSTLERIVWFAALALVGLVGKRCYDDGKRREGALNAQLQTERLTTATWRTHADSLQRTLRTDTVRLTRTLTRRDTVLRTVERVLRDTVPVPVEIVRRIVEADSQALNQCLVSLTTCAQLNVAKDSLLRSANAQIAILKAKHPSRLGTLLKIGAAFSVGYLFGNRN